MKIVHVLLVSILVALVSIQVATASTVTPTPTTTAVTLADNGKTITLQVSERFLLDLGEGYDWNVTVDNQTVISRVVNVLVIRGAQGLYEAHTPGNATLTAIGDPVCRKVQPPCGAPSLLFQLYIVVHGMQPTTPAVTPTQPVSIPEFPSLALFVVVITGVAFLIYRRL